MGWTKEQTDAINARGRSIIVSAAAGSGKTSVLVERLIRQLSDRENKIPADRMIVVTFTKDAAAEMKQRLTAALAELIEKEPENHWLNQQQLLLQSAKISTIHSFCFELIRDNIQELELSGSFRIMDETETQLIVSKAISDLVTEYYQKDIQKTEKLYEQFCYKDDNTIEDLISDIYQFSIDQTSGTVSLVKSPVFIDFSDKNSTLANSEPTIVCGANGAIYTKNFQIKKNLANEVGGYLKSIFDINDEFIYAIGSSQKVIYKFENREGYKNISRIHVSINVKDIFDYSGQIFMIGNSIDPQTGSSKLFLQRLIL